MERRLIIMRHAKSDWESGAETDHARPLNRRGRRDAPRLAERLCKLGWRPDLVLCSSATRTRETWQRMRKAFGKPKISERILDELYHAGSRELSRALIDLEESPEENAHCVLALGHNPGWEEAVNWFSGQRVVLKTCCAALLTLESTNWAAAAESQGLWHLQSLICPKED